MSKQRGEYTEDMTERFSVEQENVRLAQEIERLREDREELLAVAHVAWAFYEGDLTAKETKRGLDEIEERFRRD